MRADDVGEGFVAQSDQVRDPLRERQSAWGAVAAQYRFGQIAAEGQATGETCRRRFRPVRSAVYGWRQRLARPDPEGSTT